MGLDQRIHRFIWAATGNPYLAETLERYFALSLRIWYVVLDRVPGLGHAVHDQAELLRALTAATRRGPVRSCASTCSPFSARSSPRSAALSRACGCRPQHNPRCNG